jgi:hypothetical protein
MSQRFHPTLYYELGSFCSISPEIIIIIMFMKNYVCFLFLDPQNEIGPSISSSIVLGSLVLLVYIVMLV